MSYVNSFGEIIETEENTLRETPQLPRIWSLAEWSIAAHRNSKAHGFHDDPLDGTPERMPIRISLIHSEISELLEAFRKDPFAPCDKKNLVLSQAGEELADIVIRLFDFVVEFKLIPSQVFSDDTFEALHMTAKLYKNEFREIGTEICDMHRSAVKLETQPTYAVNLLMHQCARFAVHHGLDLEHAVMVKHTYNVGRPAMHGKVF